jgi:hypothetical protein
VRADGLYNTVPVRIDTLKRNRGMMATVNAQTSMGALLPTVYAQTSVHTSGRSVIQKEVVLATKQDILHFMNSSKVKNNPLLA